MKNKLYIKFEDLDDVQGTLQTFYKMYEAIITYYYKAGYIYFSDFMGTIILFVSEIYKGFGFTIKDLKKLINQADDENKK